MDPTSKNAHVPAPPLQGDARCEQNAGPSNSEDRLRLVIETSPVAIGFGDSTGAIFDANESFYVLTGYSRQEIEQLKLTWHQLTAPEYADIDRQIMETLAVHGKAGPYEKEYIRKDGSRVPLLLSVSALPGRDEHVAFIVDISERKRSEEALRESEAHVRRLLDTAHEGIWTLDLQGHTTYVNPRMASMLGYTPEEMLGRSAFDFVCEEDQAGGQQEWLERRREPGGRASEYRYLHKDGRSVWCQVSSSPISDSGGHTTGILGMVTDISDRKHTEDQLDRERALLQGIYDNIPVLLVLWDPHLRRFTLNRAAEDVTGWTTADANEGDFMAKVYPDPARRREVVEYMRSLCPGFRELPVTAKDGSQVPVEWANIRLRDDTAIGIGVDLRERKRADAALRESEELLRTVLDNSRDGINMLDLESGRYVFMSQAQVELTGFTREELLDFPADEALERVHPEDRLISQSQQEAIAAGRDLPTTVEYRWMVKSGEYRWFSDSRKLVRSAEGRPIALVGVSRDITERKAMEQALRDADRRKNEFLAVLSHELRNPLAPITNSLYILDHVPPGGERAGRARQVIGRQVAQLSNLVNDLLDVTRITRNKIHLQCEPLELNELVQRATEDNRSFFEQASVALEVVPAPLPLPVYADRTRLAQVVSNLLHNAAKFTPGDGHTRVTLGSEDSMAVIRVADTGAGMDEQTLERLFEPFVQADDTLDRSKGGLGLGLALAKGLVELHGGSISAYSAGLGAGAEFVVRLPLSRTEE
jgi:PAS domain S-box-containing protein